MAGNPADKRVTAVDIARVVGVSRTTVGFVLNDTPGQTISEATRTKVIDAAQRLGYRPHLGARALASGRNRIVLLVLPDWPMEYSMRRHLEEASGELDRAGYSLVTMTPHEDGRARPLWETLQPDVVMGLLPFSRERYAEIRQAGVSAIFPQPDYAEPADQVSFSEGPRLQVEHLVERGRRHLVFASSPDPRLTDLVSSRHSTALRTARERGIEHLPIVAVDSDHAAELVSSWRRDGVDGVVAYNDDIAALVVGAGVRLGLSIPEELAVVGHDDSTLAQIFVPSITTVHVDVEGFGRQLAREALKAAGESPPPPWDPKPTLFVVPRETS